VNFKAICSLVFAAGSIFPCRQGVSDELLYMSSITKDNEIKPQIIRGTPAKKEDWPATLIYQAQVPNAVRNCTSTIIGRKVLLTAAHCVKDTATKIVLIENKPLELSCEIHPDYVGTKCLQPVSETDLVGCTADVAICFTNDPLPVKRGERIDMQPPSFSNGTDAALVGYGCTIQGGQLTNDLQEGTAEVASVPLSDHKPDLMHPLKDFVQTSSKDAVLCSGDSGSGVYSDKTASTRRLKALGARGNLSSGSFLVDLSSDRISKFIEQKKGNIEVCGMDSDPAFCGN
jgi:Trypsin